MLPQSKGIGQQPIVTIAVTKKREQRVWHVFLLAPRIKKKWYLCTNKSIQKEIQCTFTLSRNCDVAEQDHMQGIKCMLLLIVLLQNRLRQKNLPFFSRYKHFPQVGLQDALVTLYSLFIFLFIISRVHMGLISILSFRSWPALAPLS